MLLVALAVILVSTGGTAPVVPSDQSTSRSTVADGSTGTDQGSTGAGRSPQAPTTGSDQAGATTAPDPSPTRAPPPGTGRRPDTGGEPVVVRQSVRCASTGTPRAEPLPSDDEQGGRRWVTVVRLAGNCDLASSEFQLRGIDTRLVWRSDADSFTVFLVDTIRGRDATAGFAEGECAGPCSENQPIIPPTGSYRLEVQAGAAPWEVEIQEYRQP